VVVGAVVVVLVDDVVVGADVVVLVDVVVVGAVVVVLVDVVVVGAVVVVLVDVVVVQSVHGTVELVVVDVLVLVLVDVVDVDVLVLVLVDDVLVVGVSTGIVKTVSAGTLQVAFALTKPPFSATFVVSDNMLSVMTPGVAGAVAFTVTSAVVNVALSGSAASPEANGPGLPYCIWFGWGNVTAVGVVTAALAQNVGLVSGSWPTFAVLAAVIDL
jgi:hypothetical protein